MTQTSKPSISPLHVLVAEDNAVNQRIARALLEKQGHTVDIAENGLETLEKFQATQYDLIFMDVQMPKLGGFEATQTIRAREEGTEDHIPIIGLTANAMEGDREACLNAGMDDYVPKPVRMSSLIEAIERTINKGAPSGQDIDISQEEPGSGLDPNTVEQLSALESEGCLKEIFDPAPLEDLRTLEDLGGFSLQDMVDLFLKDVPARIASAQSAMKKNDIETWSREAHTIKSSAHDLGGIKLAQKSEALEIKGQEGSPNGASDLLLQIQHEFETFSKALADYLHSES